MEEQRFTFDLLPDDIWLCIIGHVEHFKDRARMCQASKRLNRLVIDFYRRLKNVSFDDYKSRSLELDDLELFLKRLPNLREINFSNRNKMSVIRRIKLDDHRILTDNCKNLINLNLTRVPLAPSELLSIVTKCDKITTLILDYVRLDDEVELSRVMDACRKRLLNLDMRNVSVYRPGFINDAYIKATGLYCLKSLAIANAMLFDATNFVQSCPDLEQLSIKFSGETDDSGLADYAFNEISEIIQRCPKLKLLNGMDIAYAALPENIHLLFDCTYEEVFGDFSHEEIHQIDQLMAIFDDHRQQVIKYYQQECVSVLYGPINAGRRTFDYAKIKLQAMDESFVQNVQPGDQIYLSRKERKLLVQGIVLSQADFCDGEDYDDSFMYIVINNNAELFTSSLFSISCVSQDDFKVINIDIRSALANNSTKLEDEQRILSDGFLCDIFLDARYSFFKHFFLSNNYDRNIVRYIQTPEEDQNDSLNQKQTSAIIHAMTHRITSISNGTEDANERSSFIASLAEHLFETRCNKDSKILICAADDDTLDVVADRIHETSELKLVSYRPKYNNKCHERKPYYLDQLVRELPATFPDIQSNVITALEYFQLDEQRRRDWMRYKSRCAYNIVDNSQVLCSTYNNSSRLIDENWTKFDSVIIIDNCDRRVTLAEIRLIIQHLPRRIILMNPRSIEDIDQVEINGTEITLFSRLANSGFLPIIL